MAALALRGGQFFAPLSFAAIACLLPLWQRVTAALPVKDLDRADRNAELAGALSIADMEVDELRERLWIHETAASAFGDSVVERAADGVILSGTALGTDGPAPPAPHDMTDEGTGDIIEVDAGDGTRLAWLDLARVDGSTGLMRHFAVARAVRQDTVGLAALTTIAHDVRAPVANITGLADWLDDTDLTPAQRDHVATIRMSAREALDLMESRLPQQAMTGEAPNPTPTDMRLLIEGVARLLAPQAAAGDLALATHIDTTVADLVTLDGARLRQVLVNLTSNAVKFTRAGGVGLFATQADGILRIDVADSGPGVAEGDQDRIFEERFHAVKDNADGHGLGLAICRRLVEAMSGTLVLVPSKEGARFRIEIPVEEASAENDMPEPSAMLRLDLPASPARDALARAVRDCGLAVRIRGEADISIGGSQSSTTERRILIGHGDDAHERGGLEWLTWPVRQTSLERLLTRPVEHVALQVLLVEDDPVAAMLARRALIALGHRVTQVETIGAARKAVAHATFDVAFVDNHLPDGTGRDLLATWSGPAALLLSADANDSDVQKPVPVDAWPSLLRRAQASGRQKACKTTA